MSTNPLQLAEQIVKLFEGVDLHTRRSAMSIAETLLDLAILSVFQTPETNP